MSSISKLPDSKSVSNITTQASFKKEQPDTYGEN